jgi:hypothetical protein
VKANKFNGLSPLAQAAFGLLFGFSASLGMAAEPPIKLYKATCEYAGAGNFGVPAPVLPEGVVVTGRNTEELRFQCVQAARAKYPANFTASADPSGKEAAQVSPIFDKGDVIKDSTTIYSAKCMIGDIENGGLEAISSITGRSSFEIWRTCHNLIESRFLPVNARRATSWITSIRSDAVAPPQMGGICEIAKKGAGGAVIKHPTRYEVYSPNVNELIDECHLISETYYGPGNLGAIKRLGPLSHLNDFDTNCFVDFGTQFSKVVDEYGKDGKRWVFSSTLEARRKCREWAETKYPEKKVVVDIRSKPELF